jgi:HK97 family phage portal protein
MWPFTRAREVKEHPSGAAFYTEWGNAWTRQEQPEKYVKEGYQTNVVVYAAIQEIATAAASLNIEVQNSKGETQEGPIADKALALIDRPNPMQGWPSFCKALFIDRALHGELSMVRFPLKSRQAPTELWHINPMHLQVEPGRRGMPSKYVHEVNGRKIEYDVDNLTGTSDLFFQKTYNPLNYWRGQSPLVAAGLAADTHNVGLMWNYRMLKNGARPSGILRLLSDASADTISKAREYFKRQMQGDLNAGEVPILPNGMEWQDVGKGPVDMDFLNTHKESAKLIARAFGVPLPLIDNDAATFNNMAEAKLRFYTDTVLPQFNEFLEQFSNWLLPAFGKDLRFGVDMDRIPALEIVRDAAYNRAIKAAGNRPILTQDEARQVIGWPELGGAAAVLDPIGDAMLLDGTSGSMDSGDLTKAAKLIYG